MPFNRHDIYTSSGSVQLFNEWVPYVSKFDTSSFYNWEQDNLPLYDLEERTYELWEQNGYNTSAGVPGLALTVSADAENTVEGAAAMLANRNIFTEVSSCIAAIPKVVRFPVLVEVASFGDLGPLELHNFRIEEGGSIEIINRNFGRVYNASGDCEGVVASPTYNASHALMTAVSSLDLSSTYTDASCVHLGTTVLSSAGDTRVPNNGNSFFYPKHTLRKAPLTVAIDSATPFTGILNKFSFAPYENIAVAEDASRQTLDVSATNQSTGAEIYRVSLDGTETLSVGGNTYLNKCTKISVKNCDGPIYIRNFFVDGNLERDNAIEITNSDVLLENCAGIRAKEAGFKFNNSKVVLSRSAAAYRNYKLTSTTTREAEVGYGFHAVNSDILVSSLPTPLNTTYPGDTGGSAVDCVVAASRNYAGFVLDNSKLTGGIQRLLPTNALRASILTSELNTGFGFILDNSKVDLKGLIDVYGNDKGIQADNSKVVFENLCIDAHSGEAIKARNSQFIFDSDDGPTAAGQADRKQLDMSANGQHLDLQANSQFTFKIKESVPEKYGNSKFYTTHGVINWNAADKCALPAISVNDGSQVDLIHPNILVSGTSENIVNAPSYGRAIKAANSSKVSLFGSKTGCTFVFGPAGRTYQQKMAGVYGSNNSTINLHGPTAMAHFGVDVLVEDGSVLNIGPARKRDEFGLEVSSFDLSSGENHTAVELHSIRSCLVANKNSTINMQDLGAYPANWERTTTGSTYLDAGVDYPIGIFDTSAFTSSGSLQFYPNPQDDGAIDDLNLDDLTAGSLTFDQTETPTFTPTTGLLRFFNTNDLIDSQLVNTQVDDLTQGGVCLRASEDSVVNVKNVHFPAGTNDSPLDGLYYNASGSLCDKLMIWNLADTSRLNASYVSVSGMHPASIQYHGPSAIYASSVDGINAGNAYDAPAYGAPAKTPDTGSLSVLDAFGAGSSVWLPPSGVSINSPFDRFTPVVADSTFLGSVSGNQMASAISEAGMNVSGTTTYMWGAGPHQSNNQGVFRIYWSPKGSAKALQTDLSGYFKGAHPHTGDFSGVVGPAYQIFSQGYNCSAALSAVHIDDGAGNNIISGTYPDLLKLSYDSDGDGVFDQLYTSGFYYCSEMLEDNPTQCILDESAAKAFANAQNASIGMAGRPKKVTLVRARSEDNRLSEAYPGDASGALGFKSSTIFDLSRDN
jgi:hypothetical protein